MRLKNKNNIYIYMKYTGGHDWVSGKTQRDKLDKSTLKTYG